MEAGRAACGIVTGETGANAPFAEVVLRATVNALLASTGLPKASSSATVIVLEATPAVSVCGELVNANWLAAAGLIVSFCVAELTPATVAVMVGVPAEASVYWKLTVPAPAEIGSGEGVKRAFAGSRAQVDRQRAVRIDRIAEGIFQRDGDRTGGDAGGERLRRRGESELAGGGGIDRLVLRAAGRPLAVAVIVGRREVSV